MTSTFPDGFLWGSATSAHQTEGNNVNSDMWALENVPDPIFPERSGDACDSYHRWEQDFDILAARGFNSYRFSVEWARIEPEPGHISKSELAHYRRMIDGALDRGLIPMVTLQHGTSPRWFTSQGGWIDDSAVDRFANYAGVVSEILEGVPYVCTINEPNMIAMVANMLRTGKRAEANAGVMPGPDEQVSERLIDSHHAATAILRANTDTKVGWSIANQNFQVQPGAEAIGAEWAWTREDRFIEAAKNDDFIGIQAYTRVIIGPEGPIAPSDEVRRTQTGWEFYPEAAALALRHTAELAPGVPLIVTENGIATADDAERIEYTAASIAAIRAAIDDGVDIRGYLHWSLLDNYEWGSWAHTFGLVAVDRNTFVRTPKPSIVWLGEVARMNGAAIRADVRR